jgi:simple sugar transport system ATP-binding protein
VSERLRSSAFSRWGWVRRAAARAYAERVLRTFDVRGGGPAVPARSLSGGNMQKLILGRALSQPDDVAASTGANGAAAVPRLIVAHQPTWGLDIGAVAYVQAQLIAARDAGAAVLLISDDLDEVLTLGDRVAVIHAGRLGTARPATDWSREAIGLAMAGITEAAAQAHA